MRREPPPLIAAKFASGYFNHLGKDSDHLDAGRPANLVHMAERFRLRLSIRSSQAATRAIWDMAPWRSPFRLKVPSATRVPRCLRSCTWSLNGRTVPDRTPWRRGVAAAQAKSKKVTHVRASAWAMRHLQPAFYRSPKSTCRPVGSLLPPAGSTVIPIRSNSHIGSVGRMTIWPYPVESTVNTPPLVFTPSLISHT